MLGLHISSSSQCDRRSRRHGASRPTLFLGTGAPGNVGQRSLAEISGLEGRALPKEISQLARSPQSKPARPEISRGERARWSQHALSSQPPKGLVSCVALHRQQQGVEAAPCQPGSLKISFMHAQSPRSSTNTLLAWRSCPAKFVRCFSSARKGVPSWRHEGKHPSASHFIDHANAASKSSKVLGLTTCRFMTTAKGTLKFGSPVCPGKDIAMVSTV